MAEAFALLGHPTAPYALALNVFEIDVKGEP
jgi:hypothetical protein